MARSPHVTVLIDLDRVRANARAIKERVGVEVLAVVKADAYGLGAKYVVPAIEAIVDGFCFFDVHELITLDYATLSHKPALTLRPHPEPPGSMFLYHYRRHNARPAVASPELAEGWGRIHPILSVDTGQQRFACPAEQVDDALRRGHCREAMTHATTPAQVRRFLELAGGRGLKLHAAGSSLLDDPAARLDAVRPGLALYAGAARVSAPLVETRDSGRPAGYTGFVVPRLGVILCGYSHGLRPGGPCRVNGRPSRVLEVGMQSAFVECAPADRPGDEVVLLGDGLAPDAVAAAWGTTPHAVLVALARAGVRRYDER